MPVHAVTGIERASEGLGQVALLDLRMAGSPDLGPYSHPAGVEERKTPPHRTQGRMARVQTKKIQ